MLAACRKDSVVRLNRAKTFRNTPMNIPAENEKNVDPATEEWATELEAHIQCRLSGQVRDFQLLVTVEGIVLRGHTHTYHAKQLAELVVMEATRLPILANEIEVV